MEIALYQVKDEDAWRFSLAPEVDARYWQEQNRELSWLGVTRSIGLAVRAICRRRLPRRVRAEAFRPPVSTDEAWMESRQLSQSWMRLLAGRALLLDEVEALLAAHEESYSQSLLLCGLQWLVLEGYCTLYPGVDSVQPAWRWRCRRCGATGGTLVARECVRCQERCVVCESCFMMGRSRTCTPFFLFTGNKEAPSALSFPPEPAIGTSISLTDAQAWAVAELHRQLCKTASQILFWAVTGAGKTEMMFPLMAHALKLGNRVAWVTPRKDVVHELAPRVKQAFASYRVLALYGGSADIWLSGEVVIATAHQLRRYVGAFPLMIIDEVDAFPLYGEIALEHGVKRALAAGGKQILLTATPPAGWKSLAKQGLLPCVAMPARYHGYPLPEPHLSRVWGLWRKLKRNQPIAVLERFLRQVEERSGQALLFVPRVQDVKTVAAWLRERVSSSEEIAGVYAAEANREEEVKLFRSGKRKWLITTTILERGVTVPRAHVVVLGADHPVFDRPSLLQIAGRVGRSADYQAGEVWFVAEERTEAQLQALKETKRLNRWAAKEGFLKKGAYTH